jgi:hypothetical protein
VQAQCLALPIKISIDTLSVNQYVVDVNGAHMAKQLGHDLQAWAINENSCSWTWHPDLLDCFAKPALVNRQPLEWHGGLASMVCSVC